jgi:hypothetical protein
MKQERCQTEPVEAPAQCAGTCFKAISPVLHNPLACLPSALVGSTYGAQNGYCYFPTNRQPRWGNVQRANGGQQTYTDQEVVL